MLELEPPAVVAFVKLGVVMTDACINYQAIPAPTRYEHVAFGDTAVVIYSNPIRGARSNYEGGPSAVAAGLTGRTPLYGFHVPEERRPAPADMILHDAKVPSGLPFAIVAMTLGEVLGDGEHPYIHWLGVFPLGVIILSWALLFPFLKPRGRAD